MVKNIPKLRLRCILVLGLVCACLRLSAHQKIRFSHLKVQHGLSQSAVNCILQDRRGFMWFGTQDGLNRYDGYSFVVFKHDPADSTSLDGSFVVSIHEDRNGVLWVATLNNPGTLNRFDWTTETFRRTPADSVDLRAAHTSSVFTTYEDHAGVRWSGSVGGGVTRFDTKTGSRKEYRHDPNNPASLSDNRVYSVYGDRSGTIWVSTREGLDRYDPSTDSFIHYRHDPKNPQSLSDNWVWPVFEDRNGNFWVGTVRGGLNLFDRARGTFVRYRHDPADPWSLSDDFVLSMYQDASGLLWIGTSGDGLNTFHPALRAFRHYAHDPTDANSLRDNTIRAMLVDRSGIVWMGTPAGLERFDPATERFAVYPPDPANPRKLGDIPNVIYEDRSGVLWVGTLSNGLDRFDRATETFTHVRHDPSRPQSLSDNRIYALLEDRSGALWVGTYGGGLNRLDRKTGKFTSYQHNPSDSTSLSGKGVWALCEDHEGVLWVGTYGGGLNRYDPKTESFVAYRNRRTDPTSISDDNVTCIYEDRSHVLWIGTTGGLNRFDRATGTFTRFREKDGLSNDVIFGILEDGDGVLWLSTNRGLSRFDPRSNTFSNYDVNDGLQGNEFNQNAYAKSARTGEMYFGGGNGFTVFHPESVRANAFVPPIVFSSFRRYNTDDAEGRPIEERGIPVREKLRLSYKDNIVTFEFSALSFYNPAKNRYIYKLEGFSDNWIQLGTERRATFTNLDPGDYTLHVRGSNNDGVWNTDGASLAFVVTPPWWKTRWAYAGYAIVLVAFLYGLRRFEINRREQKARVRESELRARAAEAEKRMLQMENDRKSNELEEARALQLSMLPRELPQLPHLELAVMMKTATEVGGDYYDFHLESDGTLNIACGDATGHGMQAGTVVTLMKGLFTSDAARLDITSFLNHASRAIKNIKMGRLLMAFTLVKVCGRRISLATAGMPPVYIYRRLSGTLDEILLKGMPLGAMKNFPYVVHEDELQPGDMMLILSDGLPEQKNAAGEMFDYARLQDVLQQIAHRSPEDILAELWRGVEQWMHNTAQDDDITLIAVRMKPETTMKAET